MSRALFSTIPRARPSFAAEAGRTALLRRQRPTVVAAPPAAAWWSSSSPSFARVAIPRAGRAGLCLGVAQRQFNTDAARQPVSDELQRRFEDFMETLRDPDDVWIRSSEARKQYMLNRSDLEELGSNFIVKESPYDDGVKFKQYNLKDVVDLALRKHSEAKLLNHYSSHYLLRQAEDVIHRSVYGNFPNQDTDALATVEPRKQASQSYCTKYWYTSPSSRTVEGRQSVEQGLKTNLGICLVKGVVWHVTGSHVMFADWMHSVADVANYSYRLLDLNRSAQRGDTVHPYGYAPLRYITADRSFVFLGLVGGVMPVLSGMHELIGASGGAIALGDHLFAPAVVFLASIVLESHAIRAASQEILAQAANELTKPGRDVEATLDPKQAVNDAAAHRGLKFGGEFWQVLRYLREGRDVMSTATFTEASSGVLGAGVGLMGLATSWYLQSVVPDVCASILMASIVCGVSGFLLRRSGDALLGKTLPNGRVKALVARMEAHPAVFNVYDVKTEMVGTDTVRFKAEVQFNPQVVTERVLKVTSQKDAAVAGPPNSDAYLAYAALTARMTENLRPSQLHAAAVAHAQAASDGGSFRGGDAGVDRGLVGAQLYRNNGLFYEALVWELKDVERVLRENLLDFKNVHIDLEPW